MKYGQGCMKCFFAVISPETPLTKTKRKTTFRLPSSSTPSDVGRMANITILECRISLQLSANECNTDKRRHKREKELPLHFNAHISHCVLSIEQSKKEGESGQRIVIE